MSVGKGPVIQFEYHAKDNQHFRILPTSATAPSMRSSSHSWHSHDFARTLKQRIRKCEICNVATNSEKQWEMHCAGNKHYTELQRRSATSTSTSTFRSSNSSSFLADPTHFGRVSESNYKSLRADASEDTETDNGVHVLISELQQEIKALKVKSMSVDEY